MIEDPLSAKQTIGIVIHGGAGIIPRNEMTSEMEADYRATLQGALKVGYGVLARGGLALDAVQRAVNVLEDSPLFNAGKGAVFTHDGHNEQDATIMDGSTGMAGCVAGVRRVRNPINLARLVMEKSPHVLLIADGAERFALAQGMDLVEEKYFFTDRRWQQLQDAIAKEKQGTSKTARLSEDGRHGTVGAVALDRQGQLAAATSSGGMTNKRSGRVGDSAIVGAGTWADTRVAVSTTGQGEYFIRGVTAYDIAALMDYQDMSLADATATAMDKLGKRGGTGGLIAIDRDGNIALPFNTTGMFRGHLLPGAQPLVDIFRE